MDLVNPPIRGHWLDEEPDVDEFEWDIWHEARLTPGHCPRCGIRGHKGVECQAVTTEMLRKPS